MTAAWSVTEDILPWLGFTTAMVMVLLLPVRSGGPVSRGAKWFFLASIVCYMTGTTASILKHFITVPAVAQTIVDDVEVLWIPFILFGVYSLYARQELNDAYAAQRSVVQTSDMMESIVETTPAGIVVLDATGRITFANSAARWLLDLEEDPDLCSVRTPGWKVSRGEVHTEGEPRSDFRDLVTAVPVEGLPITVEWPNGWRRRLSVNTEPVKSGDGQVTGAIVAFVDSETGRAIAR